MRAKVSFSIFILLSILFVVTDYLQFIELNRREKMLIGWYLYLPLTFIGFILSISFFISFFTNQNGQIIKLILALPMLIYGVYFFIGLFSRLI